MNDRAHDPRPRSWSRPVSAIDRAVGLLDRSFDRLFSSALNPLHQSGTVAIAAFLVLIATGLYLFLFYRIGEPYESVRRIDREIPGGSWVRTVHTYAADLAIVAAAVHAVKMFLGGRAFGPRTRAWLSGIALVGLTLVCGWTGQVMAWDLQGQVVAVELTKLLDLLPIFSLPLGRAFSGLGPVPGSFYFMNLFLHVCLPLGLALGLWIHVAHLARPVLLPPPRLLAGVLVALAAVSALLPVPLAPPADLLAIPRDVPVDLFYNFWLPLAWRTTPAGHAALWALATCLVVSVPWWWHKRRPRPAPSRVDPELCTGCTTCYLDCPFDAVSMVERRDPGRKAPLVALVNPARCVACGICAGSCAPMGVGPPARTGRSQLAAAQRRAAAGRYASGHIVVYACRYGGMADDGRLAALDGVVVESVECAGNLHTSVLELALRAGAPGVFVLTCPLRAAPCREGPKWLHARIYEGREAELPARVDRRRVALAGLSPGEWPALREALEAFRRRLRDLGPLAPAAEPDGGRDCRPEPSLRHG